MKQKALAKILALFLSITLVLSFSLPSLADESGLTSSQNETTEDILTGTEASGSDLVVKASDAELTTNDRIALLSASVSQTSNNGANDISEKAVDSITIGGSGVKDDGSVNSYVDFTVTVNFSEDNADGTQKSGLDIKSGDTITVTWEAPDGVTFTGYSQTIALYPGGDSSKEQLGTAEVTATSVTITFNEYASKLQHVKGYVTFSIKNYGNPTSENGGTGSITSGDVTTNVTVNYGNGVIEFGSKGGAYATDGTNKIDWAIWINNTLQTNLTGNIVITDYLPETETFNEEKSFISYSVRRNGVWDWAVYTLENFNLIGGSIEIDENNKMTITIPVTTINSGTTATLIGNVGLIHFWTFSTASAGTKVSNEITMRHYETGSPNPIDNDYIGRVTVPTSSGNASGIPQGTIEITKVVNGTTDPIEGVHFRVYQVVSESDTSRVPDWYAGADYKEIVTGSDGIASIAGLNDGYYEIEEIADNLPNWIASSSLPDSVYVTIGGTAGTAKKIGNDVKTGTITATKIWVQNDGTTANISNEDRTVYFRLYRDGTVLTDEDLPDDQTAIQAVVTAAGESSAEVSWTDLPLYDNSGNEYTYTVHEVDADGNDFVPSGYTKDEDGLTVTNTRIGNSNNGGHSSSSGGGGSSSSGSSSSDGSSSYQTGSREESSVINIRKTDSNGNLLSGAEFTLYNGDTVVGTYTAGATSISSDDLKELLGDDGAESFTLRETKAPEGYVAEDKVYTITLTRDVTRQWEGSGSDRRYMTVTSYTFSSDDAVDGTLQIVNSLSSTNGNVSDYPMGNRTGEAGDNPNSTAVIRPYVRTGDESHTVLWAIICAAAVISLIGYFIWKKNKNRK